MNEVEHAAKPQPLPMLSPSEIKVVLSVYDGFSNKEVAQALFVTEKTVKFHLTNIYKKSGCKSRTELIARIFRKTIAEPMLTQIYFAIAERLRVSGIPAMQRSAPDGAVAPEHSDSEIPILPTTQGRV